MYIEKICKLNAKNERNRDVKWWGLTDECIYVHKQYYAIIRLDGENNLTRRVGISKNSETISVNK